VKWIAPDLSRAPGVLLHNTVAKPRHHRIAQ